MNGFQSISGEIFKSIQKETNGKKKSKSWYRSKLVSYLNGTNLIDESPDDGSEREYNIEVGELYFFSYSAKFAEKYPWYDVYPLTYIANIFKEGFIGYNLHYLSPTIRQGYAQSLINRAGGVNMPNKTIHRYLFSQIGSSFDRVPPTEYVGVSVLPVEQFMTVDGDEILSRKVWRS
tara:strand:+ start:4238 stop:4765 length:528 start_codon:yes stop_codon:yes gene_type:complete